MIFEGLRSTLCKKAGKNPFPISRCGLDTLPEDSTQRAKGLNGSSQTLAYSIY